MRSAAWALATSSRCSESVSAVIRASSSFDLARAPSSAPSARCWRSAASSSRLRTPTRDHRAQPSRRPAAPTRRPRRPPSRRAPRASGPAGRAPAPRARPPPPGAANPPVRERHSRAPRRCAPPAGPPPRRRAPPRRPAIDSCRSTGSASTRRRPAARCAAGSRARRVRLDRAARGRPPARRAACISRCHSSVGGAGVLAEPAELLVDRRDRGVGLVERGQRLLGGVLAGRLLGQRTGQRRGQLAGLRLGSGQFGTRLVDLGGDLQRARLAVRTAADPARRRPGRRRG